MRKEKKYLWGLLAASIFLLSGCEAPKANAGPDQCAEINTPVHIVGSGTDTDGSIVSYLWEEGATVVARRAAFDYTSVQLGKHRLRLTVIDDTNMTGSDTMVVTVVEAGGCNLHKPITDEVAPADWYLRIVAEDPARMMKTADTQLGELNTADAVSQHTLKALSPFGGTYLDVVFRDPAGVNAGDYKVNFHQYKEGSDDSWKFTVRTNDAQAEILLSWRGLYVLTPYTDKQNRQRYREYRSISNPLLERMKLVDLTTGEEMPAIVKGKVQTYTFTMDGEKERQFEWIVSAEKLNLPSEEESGTTRRAKLLKRDAKTNRAGLLRQKALKFDLTRPPMIMEDMPEK